jgi:hypothetical protein
LECRLVLNGHNTMPNRRHRSGHRHHRRHCPPPMLRRVLCTGCNFDYLVVRSEDFLHPETKFQAMQRLAHFVGSP